MKFLDDTQKLSAYGKSTLDLLFKMLSNTRYTLLGHDISLLQLYPVTIKSFLIEKFPDINLSKYIILEKFNLTNYNLNNRRYIEVVTDKLNNLAFNKNFLGDVITHYKDIN